MVKRQLNRGEILFNSKMEQISYNFITKTSEWAEGDYQEFVDYYFKEKELGLVDFIEEEVTEEGKCLTVTKLIGEEYIIKIGVELKNVEE